MSNEQIYDDERAERLLLLLRALAARINALQADQDLIAAGPELMKLIGDARSELFHYEVRSTYDSPETAQARGIVERAKQQMDHLDLPDGNEFEIDESEEDLPWQD